MKKIFLFLSFIISLFLFSQVNLEFLFDMEIEDYDDFLDFQLLDFDEDGTDDIILVQEFPDFFQVDIYNLEGSILLQNQYEIEQSYGPHVSYIFKDNDSFKMAIATSYYNQLLVYELFTGELITIEELGEEPFVPHVMGEAIDLKADVSDEQVLLYISVMDVTVYENSSGWWEDFIPYTFLYSYQNQFEFVAYYAFVAHMFLRNEVAYGVCQYSQGEFEGPYSTDYVSHLYSINQSVFPPEMTEIQEFWWKDIQFVTSDEEINNELGFVYSYWNDNTRKFICATTENDVLWEAEYPLNHIQFSANYEKDGEDYIVIFDEHKVILFNHQTGELVHSEIMDSAFGEIRKSSEGILYSFSSGMDGYQVYQLEFSDFVVSTDEEVIEISGEKLRNFPNPFNPETTIYFQLAETCDVELAIYNVMGQKVKTLANKILPAGEHNFLWDGTNRENQAVSSGIYFYRLSVNGTTEIIRKCMLLK